MKSGTTDVNEGVVAQIEQELAEARGKLPNESPSQAAQPVSGTGTSGANTSRQSTFSTLTQRIRSNPIPPT